MPTQDPEGPAEDLVPIDVAGTTQMVPRSLAEKIPSPDGGGALTMEELASAGMVPGMNSSSGQHVRSWYHRDET